MEFQEKMLLRFTDLYLQQIENSMKNVDNSKYGQSAPKLIEVQLHLVYYLGPTAVPILRIGC